MRRVVLTVSAGSVFGLLLVAVVGGLVVMFGSERLASHLIDA